MTPLPPHAAVAVLARHPVTGRVKTRLSPALPAAHAAALYAALLADTLDAAMGSRAQAREVWWADRDDGRSAFALPAAFTPRQQPDGDLGARLAAASAALLATPGTRAVIIGSDAPALSSAHLDAAFAALDSHDVVLGPADDGGYWLIGLAKPAPPLFAAMAWSTPGVLAETRARAEREGLSVALLPAMADLDTPADLARLMASVAFGTPEACGPRMKSALARLGVSAANAA